MNLLANVLNMFFLFQINKTEIYLEIDYIFLSLVMFSLFLKENTHLLMCVCVCTLASQINYCFSLIYLFLFVSLLGFESITLPPTPPSSNTSDSEGSLSPQRSAPSSPIRPVSVTKPVQSNNNKHITQPLFTNPVSYQNL